jgi:hypothetical protein
VAAVAVLSPQLPMAPNHSGLSEEVASLITAVFLRVPNLQHSTNGRQGLLALASLHSGFSVNHRKV